MAPIDFAASAPHYIDHMAPVWKALPANRRGNFYVHPRYAERVNFPVVAEWPPPPPGRKRRVTVVAGVRDQKTLYKGGRERIARLSHGAGQVYQDHHPAEKNHDGVIARLVPGPFQANVYRESRPDMPVFEVGVPKLDRWHKAQQEPNKVVAISWHWACSRCPESNTAFPYFRRALHRLSREFTVIGHKHPRASTSILREYRRHGIEYVADFDEVIERAWVYVCDNSSTMYEWASLDRPVVVVNSPRYRRDVEHGLRFWSHADLGPQADRAVDLTGCVYRAFAGEGEQRRREIVKDVYAACDGNASLRAATALLEIDRDT